MGHYDPQQSYEEMLQAFKGELSHVLAGRVPSDDASIFDVTVILALLDITNAARQGSPTGVLVTRATEAFAVCATYVAADAAVPQAINGASSPATLSVVPPLEVAN